MSFIIFQDDIQEHTQSCASQEGFTLHFHKSMTNLSNMINTGIEHVRTCSHVHEHFSFLLMYIFTFALNVVHIVWNYVGLEFHIVEIFFCRQNHRPFLSIIENLKLSLINQ